MKTAVQPKKSLGQNFLVDKNILELIVKAAGINDKDVVFEVGPGMAALTCKLAEQAETLTCIEKDERLKPFLLDALAGFDNVKLVFGDALEFNWGNVPTGSLFVANLPYYISTAIVGQVLASGKFKKLVFLVQREVAQRIVAKPGSENYGFLSGMVSLAGSAKIVRHISPQAFWPVPEVTSSLVEIMVHGKPDPKIIKMLEIVLQHRRKTLKNNLLMAGFCADLIDKTLDQLNIPANIRGEKLDLDVIKTLSNQLIA